MGWETGMATNRASLLSTFADRGTDPAPSSSTRMQHGKVKLPSGTWDWRLRPQHDGAAVTFQHRDRIRDEMRTWTSELELTEERARELGSEPVERVWVDADGFAWTIHVELPSDWGSESRDGKESVLRLVFTCGSLRRTAQVPKETRLGDLRHFDLTRLIAAASQFSPLSS